MSMRNYLIPCAVVAVTTAVLILALPAVADAFEGIQLLFLSTNAD